MGENGKNPSCDPTSLGSILLTNGMVTPEQLNAALDFQKNNGDLLLGEALVHMGIINREILEAILLHQEIERNGTTRRSNDRVIQVVKAAAQHTLAVAGAGATMFQTLHSLLNKVGKG